MIAFYIGLAVAGVVVAVIGVFVQAADLRLGGVSIPYGIFLVLGAAIGLFLIGRIVMRTRAGVVIPAVAYTLTALPLTSGRPEGDVLTPSSDLRSWAYLLVPIAAAVIIATAPGRGDLSSRR